MNVYKKIGILFLIHILFFIFICWYSGHNFLVRNTDNAVYVSAIITASIFLTAVGTEIWNLFEREAKQ